jgi:chaperonin cofactor prefoldin
MKSRFLLFLFLSILGFVNAQTITFLSEKTNKPLPKVSVFGKDGSILAYSDIDGKIDNQSLKPDQEKFQLVYNNFPVATLSYSNLNQEVIKIIDNVKDIETVVIKNTKPAKYIFVKGNFNTYVTVNSKLNCYADGIVTYIFDNKTKKLKSTNVEQYRVYRLEDVKYEKKQTAMWDYDNTMDIPDMKEVGNILEYKRKNAVIKELKGEQKDQIEITGEALQKKEFAFLGYRFFDVKSIINASYEKDTKKTLRDLLEFNEIGFLKLKHKSEPEYNQLVLYTNFYPTELDFKTITISKK